MTLSEDEEKTDWNELEVSALIDYVYQHRPEVGEGNFRAETIRNIRRRSGEHCAICIAPLSGSKEDRKDVQNEMGFGMLSSLIDSSTQTR